MNKVTDKIKSFEINENVFTINCEKNKLEYEIKDGCVNINIKNNLNERLGISCLKENDYVSLIFEKNSLEKKNPKIIKNIEYEFISDSSESETFDNIL
jgi:hypothetical protein